MDTPLSTADLLHILEETDACHEARMWARKYQFDADPSLRTAEGVYKLLHRTDWLTWLCEFLSAHKCTADVHFQRLNEWLEDDDCDTAEDYHRNMKRLEALIQSSEDHVEEYRTRRARESWLESHYKSQMKRLRRADARTPLVIPDWSIIEASLIRWYSSI